MKIRALSIAFGSVFALAISSFAPSAAVANDSPPALVDDAIPVLAPACDILAQSLIDTNEINASGGYSFGCLDGLVSAEILAPDGSMQEISASVNENPELFQLPSSGATTFIFGANCSQYVAPIRTIISELQDRVELCVGYGQNNSPVNGTWKNGIDIEWNMYPGWPAAQNKVKTIATSGYPELYGTIATRKQNGILPPTTLAIADFYNVGNQTTTGWVGELNTAGSHSLAIYPNYVVQPDKAFSFTFTNPQVAGHRFTCDNLQKRCYFPNGNEASI